MTENQYVECYQAAPVASPSGVTVVLLESRILFLQPPASPPLTVMTQYYIVNPLQEYLEYVYQLKIFRALVPHLSPL